MKVGRRGQIWLLIGLHLWQAFGFNLDEENPLIKNGEKESLFGFSLAMHHQLKPKEEQYLLVGAPKAKALPGRNNNITGGLYRCTFTTKSDDCERISVDTETEDATKDHKENQWLGVSVKSQRKGGKVSVCAHRYQYWSYSNQVVEGKCLILNEDLTMDIMKTFCRSRHATKDQFGYCQQGLSSAFTKDGQYFVYSAPGAYEWKGTVRMDPIFDGTKEFYETGNKNDLRHEHIPLDVNSYLGFSLDTGKNLLGKDKTVIVAGAPRSSFSGEVLLLSPEVSEGVSKLVVKHVLSGPGLASSFGYSLVVIDINADGWDDLIVGAPQFFKKGTNTEEGDEKDSDETVGGAVYVYINNAGGQDWDKIKPQVLYGEADSMFGLSVASIGDVDHDGFNDFAVGSPYLDNGAVHIFLGSASGASEKNTQVIYEYEDNLDQFGYSLAGNMDIDGNGYPDLAVGSLSDGVMVFRSKPVVNIERSLKLTPNEIDFKANNCQKRQCDFTAESCFSYTTYPSTYAPTLKIMYSLQSDGTEEWNKTRVYISRTSKTLKLFKPGEKYCDKERISILENIKDMLTDITIKLDVDLTGDEPANPPHKTNSLRGLQPALRPLHPKEAKFKFLNTGCGSDDVCQSNLQIQHSFCNKDLVREMCTPLNRDNGVAVISADVNNTALKIRISNKGGDDAHYTRLLINYTESLPVTYIQHNKKDGINCRVERNKTRVKCELENPFKRDTEGNIYLMFSTEKPVESTTNVNISMKLETISEQVIPQTVAQAKLVVDVGLKVFGQVTPSQFYYEQMKNEKETISEDVAMSMMSEGETNSVLKYEFRISNIGRPVKSQATLNIHWPKKNKDGMWILYLLKIIDEKNQIIPCMPAEEIDPLKKLALRQKRQAGFDKQEDSERPAASAWNFWDQNSYQFLTCANKLQCVEIKCPLEVVDETKVVTVLAQPWSSTFLKEYSTLNYLDIFVTAALKLNETSQANLEASQIEVKLQVFPKERLTLLAKHPWWTAFLSVVLALMLLALLLWALFQFGCLKCEMCKEDDKGYHHIPIKNAM